MKLSSFVGRMFALKNELFFVLPKVTDAKTYLSNMDKILMILTLIKLGTKFDNIQEQIFTGSAISTFDDNFARLLLNLSIATQSRHSKASLDTSMMVAPSNPRDDSQSICGCHRGRG